MNPTAVFLHLLGAAIWIGGLIFIGLTAGVARRTVPDANRAAFFRALGLGFLALAGFAATLLLISGNLLVEDLFGGWDALGGSSSGELVLWKTALFALVLALALVHAFVLGPRIRRSREALAAGRDAGRAAAPPRHLVAASAVTQVLMLAGTLAILALAADLTS